MTVTTKELRIQPGKIIDHVACGQEVIVTFRGKEMAKIVPLEKEHETDNLETDKKEESIFGMWKDREEFENVDESVRNLRKGRTF